MVAIQHSTIERWQDGMNSSSKRGFAAMKPEDQKAIASKGGRAFHASGKGHEWSAEEARSRRWSARHGGTQPECLPVRHCLGTAEADATVVTLSARIPRNSPTGASDSM